MSGHRFARARRAALAVPAALLLTTAFGAAPATAQLPGGMDPAQVAGMIPSEITVPAGETTTVDVGVPVDVNYSSGGWTVTSNGTSVSVTAPDQDGATASVPASAGGYSATVTLVAVGGGANTDAGEAADGGGAADAPAAQRNRGEGGDRNGGSEPTDGGSEATGRTGEGAGAAQRPERKQAEKADATNAKRLEFEGEIRGNQIVVKVPLRKAADLMRYANYDTSNATVRYLDVNGRIIEGVERDVDIKGRTLTLTYPEGETPDNPFIIEVVEDGAATFVAVITSANAEVERPENEGSAEGDGYDGQVYEVDKGSSSSGIAPLLIGGAALFAALALLIVFLRKRSRGRV